MAEEGDKRNDERLARGTAHASSFRPESVIVGTVYDEALKKDLSRLLISHQLSVLLEPRDVIGHIASVTRIYYARLTGGRGDYLDLEPCSVRRAGDNGLTSTSSHLVIVGWAPI